MDQWSSYKTDILRMQRKTLLKCRSWQEFSESDSSNTGNKSQELTERITCN